MTLQQELAEYVHLLHDRRYEFQLDRLQVAGEPTTYGRFMSAARRMLSSIESILMARLKILECSEKMAAEEKEGRKDGYEWKRAKMVMDSQESMIPRNRTAAARLFAHCRALRSSLPDLSDPKVQYELERELQMERFRLQIAIDILQRHPTAGHGTLVGGLALRSEDRMAIIEEMTESGVDPNTGTMIWPIHKALAVYGAACDDTEDLPALDSPEVEAADVDALLEAPDITVLLASPATAIELDPEAAQEVPVEC